MLLGKKIHFNSLQYIYINVHFYYFSFFVYHITIYYIYILSYEMCLEILALLVFCLIKNNNFALIFGIQN